MKIQRRTIYESVLVIYVLSQTFIGGMAVLCYIILIRAMMINLKEQILMGEEEDIEKKDRIKRIVKPKMTADQVIFYKDCTIEIYSGVYFMTDKSGRLEQQIFNNMKDIKKQIDIVSQQ